MRSENARVHTNTTTTIHICDVRCGKVNERTNACWICVLWSCVSVLFADAEASNIWDKRRRRPTNDDDDEDATIHTHTMQKRLARIRVSDEHIVIVRTIDMRISELARAFRRYGYTALNEVRHVKMQNPNAHGYKMSENVRIQNVVISMAYCTENGT